MKRFLFLILACLLAGNSVCAQTNITIQGESVDAAGKTVVLGGYTDKISGRELALDKMTVSADGRFELHGYARYPMLVFLQIENYSQSFYVVPGGVYKVHIPGFDWMQDEAVNVFLNPVTLPVEFLSVPADDPNAAISQLDGVVDQYISDNRVHFDERYRPDQRYFDSLLAVVDKECPDGDNEFFNRYKRYNLAKLRLDLKFASKKQIYETYFRNQPVLCYDDNYMALFTSLYGHFISKGSRRISLSSLSRWVEETDTKTFIDSLGVEPLLRHEQIRELAALLALKEMYYNTRYFKGDHVVQMIQYLRDHTKFADHKPIAQNILDGLGEVQQTGNEVPDFLLPDVDKQMVSLSSLRGKWVYLSFVRVDEPACQGEIETLAHFRDTIYHSHGDVAFVSICCDREFQKMYHFLKNSRHGERYDWTWLYFNGDYDMLRTFRVVSYPTFILIDPEGKIYYDITPSPSSGFLTGNAPWQNGRQHQEGGQENGSPLGE